MSQNPEMPLPVNATPNLTTCSNCHSAMPSELRFCRNCGFRLGDGLAEYTETVRFDGQRGPLAPGSTSEPMPMPARKRRRMSGMAWVFVGLLIFFVGAAAFTAVISPIRHNNRRTSIVQTPENRSYAGVRDWNSVDNGVTFNAVSPPDGPADKAGLVGGDVIVSFDGQPIHNEDEMTAALTRTPPGKTVDIQYLRDGEPHSTKLTTITEDQLERLSDTFGDREETAQFGYEERRAKRVEIPGTKMFGVQLNKIYSSLPADMAGVKEGDIVIQFNDIPIRTSEEFLMRIRRAVPYSTVTLKVMRAGEKLEIPVKMGKQD
jgi:C-terminal processing protease CtpA/Prc